MPSCSVIIVTHNSELYLPKVMRSLAEQTLLPSKIIITDSGSLDTSYLSHYEKWENVEVIYEKGDIGFCRGNNLGWEKIEMNSDYIFFLNPDAIITKRFIQKAIDFMEHPKNHDCGAITGITLGYDIQKDKPTGNYDSTGIFQKWYGRWYDRAQGKVVNPNHFQNQEEIPAICGAVFFCRKKALESILLPNGDVMDSSFFMYKEDIDLSLRLRENGWNLQFVPSLIAYHCRGWKRNRRLVPYQFRLISARNELYIQKKYRNAISVIYSLIKYASVKYLNI